MLLSPRPPSATVMRLLAAYNIGFYDLVAVYRRLDRMCRMAALPQQPELYLLRGRHLNDFAVGNRKYLAFAITDGMLRAVTMRELLAVLAHEIATLPTMIPLACSWPIRSVVSRDLCLTLAVQLW